MYFSVNFPDPKMEFQDLVDIRCKEHSHSVLANSGSQHAAIVISKMFDQTQNSVKMLVGCLDGTVSNQSNYLHSLKNVLSRHKRFEILFNNIPDINVSKAYQLIKRYLASGSNIEEKVINSHAEELLNKAIKSKNANFHFAIFDNDKYRFEFDTQNYNAFFCFNDNENVVENLREVFDSAFEISNPIP